MIAMIILSVLLPVVALLITLSNEVLGVNYDYGEDDVTYNAIIVAILMIIVCGVFSLINATKMFSEIYKKQSCDLYFSMPIKREEYFGANFLYGAVINVCSFVISGCIYNFVAPMFSNKYITLVVNYSDYFPVAIPLLLALLAIYSAFVMCAVTAGKKIQYFLFAVICLLCSSSVIDGFVTNVNTIWGLLLGSAKFNAISPVENAIKAVSLESKYVAYYCIVSVIEIIGMFFAGLLIFKHRRAEVAEVEPTGKIIPYLLLAVLVGGAFTCGNVAGNGLLTIIFGVIIAVLIAMAFSGIFYKKVFTKKTGFTTVATCLVCALFIAVVYVPSHNFYVKNVPDASEVESIELAGFSSYAYYYANNYYAKSYTGDYYDGEMATFEIKEPENIEKAIALHQKLVDDNTIEKSKKAGSVSVIDALFNDDYDYEYLYDCQITYMLKSGKKLTRTYSAVSSRVMSEYVELMKSEEILDQTEPFNINDDDILFVLTDSYDDSDDEYYNYDSCKYLTLDQLNEFKSVYKADLQGLKTSQFLYSFDTYATGFDYSYYTSEDAVGYLEIYTISPNATDEMREKISKMSPAAIQKMYDSYSDEEFNNAINETYFNIYSSEENTVSLLKSFGIDIK
jgi:hypothetical protein